MVLAVGDRLGRFEIRGPVGAGGMGEVYRAWDEVLEREVAVKVLPIELADDPSRSRRFEREAKAVARLSHPNILAIHDFGSDDGVSYAVTELLEGESIRERLGRAPMDWRTAVTIGAEAAVGLAAAHREGIIHRDLKPENLFLTTDDAVKILDFGLAQVVETKPAEASTYGPDDTVTQQGTVVGTVGYMSPEQLKGEPTDARSDIFALGCVLYELLSCRRAFKRNSTPETMAAILHEEPPSFEDSGIEVAPELTATIERCLHKNPDHRYQSAADLAFALRALLSDSGIPRTIFPPQPWVRWLQWIAVAGTLLIAVILIASWMRRDREPPPPREVPSDVQPNRVAIAAIENRSGDPNLDPLGLQISDAIAGLLDTVDGAEVAIEGASFTSDEGADVAADRLLALAEASRAGLVVTGTFYLKGDEIELSTRIVDPWTGDIAQSFGAEHAPVLDLKPAIDAVAQRVTGSLAAHFDAVVPLGVSRPFRLDAYREYTAAWSAGRNRPATFERFERALELEPDFVLAGAALFWAHWNSWDIDEAEERVELLEGRLPEMTPFEQSLVRATRTALDGQPLGVLSATRESVSHAPDALWLQSDLGMALIRCNRAREVVGVLRRFPYDWISGEDWRASQPFLVLGMAYHMLGEHESGLRLARENLAHFPDTVLFAGQEAAALAALGRIDEINRLADESFAIPARGASAGIALRIAAEELRAHGYREQSKALAERVVEWYRNQPSNLRYRDRMRLAKTLRLADRWDEARAILEELVGESRHKDPGSLGLLGAVEAHVGNHSEAERLAEAIRAMDQTYTYGQPVLARAGIAAQLGDRPEAMRLLRQAISEGHGYWIGLHNNLDFEPLWDDPEFLKLITPKG